MQQRLPTVMVLRYVDRNGNTRATSLRSLDTSSIPEDRKLTYVDGNPARPNLFVGQLMRSRYNRELVLPVAMNLYDRSARPIGLLVPSCARRPSSTSTSASPISRPSSRCAPKAVR